MCLKILGDCMRMLSTENATKCCIFILICVFASAHSYAVNIRDVNQGGNLVMEPEEAIVYPGRNITFTCTYHSNLTFIWDFTSMIQNYNFVEGAYLSSKDHVLYYSKLNIYSTTRLMSGEITCSIAEDKAKAVAFLIVNGVRNGGSCQTSSDCVTDKSVCQNGLCECPLNHVRLHVKDRGYDICREMIYSLYDPCEYDEQCAHLVDSRSVCKSVCVCAPWARDIRGRCVLISEIAYNRSQEMYRVGLIAVTCIIILIVAVSLWVTLRKSCQDQNLDGQRRSITQADFDFPTRFSIDLTSDKPPSYDDILVKEEEEENKIANPPNFKDALKHCMTAKRLLRQVSAPAGVVLPTDSPILKTESKINKEV
ncbi:uncharacterized protein [Parasteatoda tepidariorum]|nr:uncharacterized protein LOC107443408 isoform X2 [Parasteatoda tepidariorum]